MSESGAPAPRIESLGLRQILAGWLLLASVLLLGWTVLAGSFWPARLAALLGAAAGALGAWRFLRSGAPAWLGLGTLGGAIGLALFLKALLSASAPALPLLQGAILLAALGATLTAAVSGIGLARPAPAGLLGFALALALFLGEAGLRLFGPPPPGSDPVPIWSGRTESHPELGMTYLPHSRIVSYYPSNPAGYFEPEDPRERSWHLELQRGTVARLEFPADRPEVVRVTISDTRTDTVWLVQLERRRLAVRAGPGYSVRFRARADQPRRAVVALAQNGPTWSNLGLYRDIELSADWQSFEESFAVTRSDANARIHFNLAGSLIPVEFAGVRLIGPDGAEVPQDLPGPRFLVRYAFNDQGCRGRDYPLARRPGTVRILALGDSYTLGTGVHEGDTFAARLERELNAADASPAAGARYEVINCGVAGYGTREERRFYELIGARYQPDIVLVSMVFNDDLSWQEEVRRGLAGQPPGRLSRISRLSGSLRRIGAPRSFGYSPLVGELLQLDRAVKQHGGRLLVASFGSAWDPARDELTRTVREGLRDTGIPVLDLNRVLHTRHDPAALKAHPLDGHLNALGHGTVADELSRYLRELGWLGQP